MEKGQSQRKANKGMHRFILGRPFAVLVGPILLSMLVINHLKKKQKREEKESTEGAPSPSIVSPIPSGGGSDQYDVFLSFRGLDTRDAFTDHLYHGLFDAGTVPIWVFRDDNSIPKGEEFVSQLFNAITQSKILIPIISENYASSKWCLHELRHIMDCKESKSHIVLPIFYKVDPADVRYQRGKFGKAFRSRNKRFDKKDIDNWERALREVSFLHGWTSDKITNRREGELVREVIKTVLNKLRHHFQLDVPKQLVGIRNHVNKIKNWVDTDASHARMIGIYGMGGIGKTTLAKVIYNELSNVFVHRSYLPNIRETADRNGIPYLQNILIKEVQPIEHQVWKYDDGINLIKSRFKGKKVLILLDDIDHKNQLNALARERSWFTPGSIIIVTTRNKGVLDRSEFGVDYKYELTELDMVPSLLLFNRHAFRMDHSSSDFKSISHDIVSTMGGHPLALEVIGSFLYGQTDQKVWEDMPKKLKKEPCEDVRKTLKISYDALQHEQQEIFLDIACFLIGEESRFAIYMWKDCGFSASEGIEQLKQRCLIKIGDDGRLRMHDQLRDLGRSIVCQDILPEIRSRLWVYKEALKVIEKKKGTNKIQAICLDKFYDDPSLEYGPADHLQTYATDPVRTYTYSQFKNLQSLKFLQLRRAALSGDFNKPFSQLIWLRWIDIEPNKSFLASDLHLPKLAVLQLSRTQITEDWGGWNSFKVAERLKVLDLAWCNNLRCTPDLSALTELEILILKHCDRLEQVHSSIGKVKSLVSLDLSDCGNLKEIPTSIGDLQNLQHLDISRSAIQKLPGTIGRLKKLQRLSLKLCYRLKGKIPSEIDGLCSLEILEITSTQISDLSKSIRPLSLLRHLSLWGCYELRSLPELPFSLTNLSVSCQSSMLPQISSLTNLEKLHLYRCDLLENIPELRSRPLKLCVASCPKLKLPKLEGLKYLEELSIENCSSITRLDLSQLNHLKRLHTKYCNNLVEIQGHNNLEILEEIVIDCCKSIERLILPELLCLKQLKANSCNNLVEIRGLDRAQVLEALDISDCGSLERLPELSCFKTLKELNIRGYQSQEKLPNLSKFEKLENFTIRHSLGVTEIPGVEESRSLIHIDITGCKSMETLPDLSGCEKLQSLLAQDCKKLTQLQGLDKLIYLDISGCNSLEIIPELHGTCVLRN